MLTIIKTLRILFRTFGFKFKYLIIPIYRFIYSSINYFGLFIDELFFRNYRRVKIEKPIFLIGHPRSGTTFLHKFFLKNCKEFEGMYLWRMIFSSLTLRKVVKPILPLLNRIFPKNLYDPKIHKTGFLEAETDDVALFFKKFDGMFYWLYFLALNEYSSFNELEKDLIQTTKLDRVLNNLENLFKKNLYNIKFTKRVFSKSFSLIIDLKKVKNKFKDAKVVVLIRDPLEVIPSSMSLARNVQMNLNSFNTLEESIQKNYYSNLYNASLVFYKQLYNQISNSLFDKDDFLIVNYKQLINNFETTLGEICSYCQIEITSNLLDAIKEQSLKQTNYKTKHEYTLEEFGLTKEKILSDFNFLYSNFDI